MRHTQRWRLGTPYDAVIDDVAELMRRPELAGALLAFDRTGVGGAVADLVMREWREGRLWHGGERPYGAEGFMPHGVTLTAGFSPERAAEGAVGSTTAHKGDLIQRMTMLLGTGRLILPPGLPGGEQLEKELRAYTIKQTKTGHVYTEAKRESDHDDIVIALALVRLDSELLRPGAALHRRADRRAARQARRHPHLHASDLDHPTHERNTMPTYQNGLTGERRTVSLEGRRLVREEPAVVPR